MVLTAYLSFAAAVIAVGVACFVLLREARSLARTSLVAGLLLLAAESMFAGLSCHAVLPADIVAWQRWRIAALALLPAAWLLFGLSYARGNVAEELRRWRFAVAALAIIPPLAVAVYWRTSILGILPREESNAWMLALSRPAILFFAVIIVGFVAVLMNLERTLRAATGTMRWRIKFMAIGVGLLLASRIYTATQTILYSAINTSLAGLEAGIAILCLAMMFRSLLRTRLLHVDVYPSHAVLFHSLTVVLAGVYLLAVGVLAQVLARFGDAGGFPLKAFFLFAALITLAAIWFSDRVRQSIRTFVSRHFLRPQYDYRRLWSLFASQTVSAVSAMDLCRTVTRLVSETLDLLSVTIWLKDPGGERLRYGGSTMIAEARAAEALTSAECSADTVAELADEQAPLNIDRRQTPVAEMQRELNPPQFPGRGGDRYAVTMTAADQFVGVLVVGDRVRGIPLTAEELELLKAIAEQAAARLYAVRLSERLAEARQLEAFQAMSTFFVHDLKNTSSTLSLMLRNLPKHFDDPEFRKDALEAIGESVEKIERLIERLTTLREKLDIQPVPGQLNDVVASAVGTLEQSQAERIRFDPGELPEIPVDADALQKVFANLLLNAIEASSDEQDVSVVTSLDGANAVAEVSDRGSGMSEAFIRNSLFRPFKTTKKRGMGIGLFQSKMIVEAHGGRIEVRSEPGKGSVFRVVLAAGGGGKGRSPL